MILYNVSVFLRPEFYSQIQPALSAAGMAGSLHPDNLTDQTGTTVSTLVCRLNGLTLIFLPANDFHRHLDFEIGLTTETLAGWDQALQHFSSQKLLAEAGFLNRTSTPYALLGGPEIHGPFFALFNGDHSRLESGESLEFSLPPAEYGFYRQHIEPILEPALATSFLVSRHPAGLLPTLQKISLKETTVDFTADRIQIKKHS